MNKKIIGILVAIICLFVGASVVPVMSEMIRSEEGMANTVWDNGLDYESMANSQEGWFFESHIADDFILDDTTELCRIKWIGGYWGENYQSADNCWRVSFFKSYGPHPSCHSVWNPSQAGPISLHKNDITRILLKDTGNQIYYEMTADLKLPSGIYFNAGEKYWVTIWDDGDNPPIAGWGYHRTVKSDPAVWGSDDMNIPYWTPGNVVLGFDFDMAFQLFEPSAKICCDGSLNWPDVPAGGAISGSFRISNCGEANTMLDWEVGEYPTWGSGWILSPESGMDLKPEDGWITIQVQATVPTQKNREFTGKIKMINEDNPSDYCEIPISLTVPKNKAINTPFLSFLEQHPHLFPLLQKLLEL